MTLVVIQQIKIILDRNWEIIGMLEQWQLTCALSKPRLSVVAGRGLETLK